MPPTEYTKEAFDKEVDALVTKMRAYEPKVDGKTIHAAFDYALKMHGAQARESGEPYVVHPLKVAEILADPAAPLHALVDENALRAGMLVSAGDYGRPWFGQLMAGPQMLAYLVQLNAWMVRFGLTV